MWTPQIISGVLWIIRLFGGVSQCSLGHDRTFFSHPSREYALHLPFQVRLQIIPFKVKLHIIPLENKLHTIYFRVACVSSKRKMIFFCFFILFFFDTFSASSSIFYTNALKRKNALIRMHKSLSSSDKLFLLRFFELEFCSGLGVWWPHSL